MVEQAPAAFTRIGPAGKLLIEASAYPPGLRRSATLKISSSDNAQFAAALGDIRNVRGRRFDRTAKAWILPAQTDREIAEVEALAARIAQRGWDVVVRSADGQAAASADPGETLRTALAALPPGPAPAGPQPIPAGMTSSESLAALAACNDRLGVQLRPYQRMGAATALSRRRLLLADEPGLGKTFQALAAVEAADGWPAVVVCPAVLRSQWASETARVLPGRTVRKLDKPAEPGAEPDADLTIVGYESLERRRELIPKGVCAVVLDEMHYLQNREAARTKSTAGLVGSVINRRCGDGGRALVIGLSGTPMRNGPANLEPFLHMTGMLQADFGMTPNRFLDRYAPWKALTVPGGRIVHVRDVDMELLPEMHAHLAAGPMLRRLKSDVLEELPAKTSTMVPLNLDRAMRRLYEQCELRVAESLADTHISSLAALARSTGHTSAEDDEDAPAQMDQIAEMLLESVTRRVETLVRSVQEATPSGFAQVTFLRQLAAAAKAPAAAAWIQNWLVGTEPSRKLIIWCYHRATVERLAGHFDGVALHGGLPLGDRQQTVKEWTTPGGPRVLAAGIMSAGTGLNLQAASDAVFVEHPWTHADIEQAEDRLHRMGQIHPTQIYHLAAADTIDEQVLSTVLSKSRVVGAGIDGRDADQALAESLAEWLESLDTQRSADSSAAGTSPGRCEEMHLPL